MRFYRKGGRYMNLKAYLANNNMTAIEFSKMIGCASGYVSHIMSKRYYPSKRLANEIFRVTNGMVSLKTAKEAKKQPPEQLNLKL